MQEKGQRVGYIRVSTLNQNHERQLEGVLLDRKFIDKASGKDARRPQLEELIRFVRSGDTVVVHSMDRLARNLVDLRSIVSELTGRGIRVEFIKDHLVFTGEDSPMSHLMLSTLGGYAEFERAISKERQMEGIELAKKRGAYIGRKKALSDLDVTRLIHSIDSGGKKSHIAKEFGISRETMYKYYRKNSERKD
jgi:DNA invertase Pin-like site-specific DNA recombinase